MSNLDKLPKDAIEGLSHWFQTYGRRFKSEILDGWNRNVEMGDYRIQMVRNIIGPSGLMSISSTKLIKTGILCKCSSCVTGRERDEIFRRLKEIQNEHSG
jgi:hypothetical protein